MCECAVYVCSESEYINVIIFVVLAFSGLYCEYVSISELFCCLRKGNGGRMNFIGDEYNNNNRLYRMFTLLSLLCSCFCCWRVVVFLSKVVCVHKFKHLLEGRPFFVVSAVAVAVFVRGNSGDRLDVRLAECINIHYPIADDDVFVCCCYVRHFDDDGGGDGGGFVFFFLSYGG